MPLGVTRRFFPINGDRLIDVSRAEKETTESVGSADSRVSRKDRQLHGERSEQAHGRSTRSAKVRAWQNIKLILSALHYTFEDVGDWKLRELIVAHDAYLLQSWDKHSMLCHMLEGIQCVLIAANSKTNPRPKSPNYYNPYREHKPEGQVINSENFDSLKYLAFGARRSG